MRAILAFGLNVIIRGDTIAAAIGTAVASGFGVKVTGTKWREDSTTTACWSEDSPSGESWAKDTESSDSWQHDNYDLDT